MHSTQPQSQVALLLSLLSELVGMWRVQQRMRDLETECLRGLAVMTIQIAWVSIYATVIREAFAECVFVKSGTVPDFTARSTAGVDS